MRLSSHRFTPNPYASSLGEVLCPLHHLQRCDPTRIQGAAADFPGVYRLWGLKCRWNPRLAVFAGNRWSGPCSTPDVVGTMSASDRCSASASHAAPLNLAIPGPPYHAMCPARRSGKLESLLSRRNGVAFTFHRPHQRLPRYSNHEYPAIHPR